MKTKKYNRKAAGIDTGKDKLDIAIYRSHDPLEVANDTAGHEQLIEWLVERKIKRIGIEASGDHSLFVAATGLDAYDHDSGRFKGQRRIAGGRGRVRKALYAAAFPAAFRWNPHLIAFYKRLTECKKTHKQVLIAGARKLLVMVNAVVARGTPWIKTQTVT